MQNVTTLQNMINNEYNQMLNDSNGQIMKNLTGTYQQSSRLTDDGIKVLEQGPKNDLSIETIDYDKKKGYRDRGSILIS